MSDYGVGYKKPPKKSQFKPGHSGNKKGRPKGAKNIRTELAEELSERILIKEGGKQKKVSKQRAMIKALMAKSVLGDTKAANTLINMTYRFLGDQNEEPEDLDLTKADQEILEAYASEILSKPKKKKEMPND